MPSLAVFDFDRTVVDDDSDATIIRKLKEKQTPPVWQGGNSDWTPYMSNVFEHAFTAGLSQEDILSAISSMKATPGIETLIQTLADEGWDILLLTDANSVFVNHWLKTHELLDYITQVVTNRAFFQNGRLYIEPYMEQKVCPRCPINLCKKLALQQWCGNKNYDRIIYSGDGRNDFCPSTILRSNDTIFPRRDYPMHDLIKRDAMSENKEILAEVVPWDNSYCILREVFPEKEKSIIIN